MRMGAAQLQVHKLLATAYQDLEGYRPLMKLWCAEGDLPTAANLYRRGNSRVGWHSDDEPLFGGGLGCRSLLCR